MLFGFAFAVNSSVHSFLIPAFSDVGRVSMNVGFRYMSNAAAKLVGTLSPARSPFGRATALPDDSGFNGCHQHGVRGNASPSLPTLGARATKSLQPGPLRNMWHRSRQCAASAATVRSSPRRRGSDAGCLPCSSCRSSSQSDLSSSRDAESRASGWRRQEPTLTVDGAIRDVHRFNSTSYQPPARSSVGVRIRVSAWLNRAASLLDVPHIQVRPPLAVAPQCADSQ